MTRGHYLNLSLTLQTPLSLPSLFRPHQASRFLVSAKYLAKGRPAGFVFPKLYG